MKWISTFIFSLVVVLLSSPVFSWDGVVEGKISRLDVSNGDVAGYRVMLKNVSSMCTRGWDWAYLNHNDTNYNAFISTLLAAKVSGTTVKIHSNHDASSQQYCHIGYIMLMEN